MARDRGEFTCAHCLRRNCGDGRLGDRGPAGYAPNVLTAPDGSLLWAEQTCPLPEIPAWSYAVMSLWWHWADGRLAVAGGVLDQPAWYVEAMRWLDSVSADYERQRAERERR